MSTLFKSLMRLIGWICLIFCALTFLAILSIYVPCFIGESGACLSGILLVIGVFFVLISGGLGWLLLTLANRKNKNV